MTKRKDILSLISRYRTELMGFAALWILLYHEWWPVFEGSLPGKVEHFLTEMGFYGVDIFFFLSGMGLVFAIGKHSVKTFYQRRLKKLLVPYVVTLLISMVVHRWDGIYFLQILTGWNFWMVDMYTEPWYICAILTLYLLFPLYYKFFRSASRKELFLGLTLVLWLILSNLLRGVQRYDLYGFTNRIPVFLTGVLVGEYCREGKPLRLSAIHWAVCCVMLCAGVVGYYLTYYKKLYILVPASECFLPDYLITLSGVCILSRLLCWLENWECVLLTGIRRVLRFLGTLSLELYCVQYILLQQLQIWMDGKIPRLFANLVDFYVIVLASYGLHKLCAWIHSMLPATGKTTSA